MCERWAPGCDGLAPQAQGLVHPFCFMRAAPSPCSVAFQHCSYMISGQRSLLTKGPSSEGPSRQAWTLNGTDCSCSCTRVASMSRQSWTWHILLGVDRLTLSALFALLRSVCTCVDDASQSHTRVLAARCFHILKLHCPALQCAVHIYAMEFMTMENHGKEVGSPSTVVLGGSHITCDRWDTSRSVYGASRRRTSTTITSYYADDDNVLIESLGSHPSMTPWRQLTPLLVLRLVRHSSSP